MRQSQLFTKTRKDAPKDEMSKNAQLLIRAGFIHKEMAGVYSFLPLGLKVLKKIEQIIREEMNAIGGQEIELTALQDKKIWDKTNRWDDSVVDIWFKSELKNDTEIGLAFTQEEPLTMIMTEYIRSFRDLPVYVYQIQTKFRNEIRAKSGIMRSREFLMKDMYSFSKDDNEHTEFYEKMKKVYMNIFRKVGIGDITYETFASGGSFSKYSHEFQTITDAGEDNIYISHKHGLSVSKDLMESGEYPMDGLKKEDFEEKKSVEVGNIFSLGDRFSKAFDLCYTDEGGQNKSVIMGSYGIGLGRLIGTVAEVLSDDRGLIWPKSIAPFEIHLILIADKDGKVKTEADKLYDSLIKKGIEVLYDDRDMRAGEKFADSDLIGIPTRIVISDKTLKSESVEIKNRKSGEVSIVKIESL